MGFSLSIFRGERVIRSFIIAGRRCEMKDRSSARSIRRELGIVESEEQLAMVAVWVRVGISGGQPMVMEVGVMSVTDLLGERSG